MKMTIDNLHIKIVCFRKSCCGVRQWDGLKRSCTIQSQQQSACFLSTGKSFQYQQTEPKYHL